MRTPTVITISEYFQTRDTYTNVIDVRSPGEFALDHIIGAINAPVLSDDERILIGTLHKQVSAFDAARRGAALVSRNIAEHIEEQFSDKPRDWKPVVYCWRGGQRSNAMATVLARIGWKVAILDGGYKSFRRAVIDQLITRPQTFRYLVIAGRTGSAKSALLEKLAQRGHQVLDLEALAAHRGSLLGDLPNQTQPGQCMLETMIANLLQSFDPHKPIMIESESKKVGKLHVPDALMMSMRASPVLRVDASVSWRAQFLLDQYQHFVSDTHALQRQLGFLVPLHGQAKIDEWNQLIHAQDWQTFVERLLSEHYDPAYDRAMLRNYVQLTGLPIYPISSSLSCLWDESQLEDIEKRISSLSW
jgi:tRNA 2-selenouridine synthase